MMKISFLLTGLLLISSVIRGQSSSQIKYAEVIKDKKGLGYNVIQNILRINEDSTFTLDEYQIRKIKEVHETISLEEYEGKWEINKDTLILKFKEAGLNSVQDRKFLIRKKRLYFMPYRYREYFVDFNYKEYPWKYLSGIESFRKEFEKHRFQSE
jgi:hypothetical protein